MAEATPMTEAMPVAAAAHEVEAKAIIMPVILVKPVAMVFVLLHRSTVVLDESKANAMAIVVPVLKATAVTEGFAMVVTMLVSVVTSMAVLDSVVASVAAVVVMATVVAMSAIVVKILMLQSTAEVALTPQVAPVAKAMAGTAAMAVTMVMATQLVVEFAGPTQSLVALASTATMVD